MSSKNFRVGSIVLSTHQGLSYLAKDFYDNGVIDNVYVRPHSTRENHYNWYPNRYKSYDEMLDDIDVLLMFETPFDWKVIPKAREKGVKTILMPMYECTNNPFIYEPDLVLCPSLLDMDYYKDKNPQLVTVPVDKPWKLRKKAKVFVHNAGNLGLGGRNGTHELLEAMKHVKSPIELIVRSQVPIKEVEDPRITYKVGTFDDIWGEGDVFVFPEKFNGLSLPLQEAYASGILVMAGDRYPINTWLPKEPLIPIKSYRKENLAVEFDYAEYDPKDIAETIDSWYNSDIEKYSLMGKKWGEENSWNKLKDKYIKICETLIKA